MNHNKDKTTDFSLLTLFTVVVLTFVLIVLTIYGLIWFSIKTKTDAQNKLQEIGTVTIEYPSELTFTLEYDTEPVDLMFTSPSGQEYKSTDENANFTLQENQSETFTIATDEIGTWSFSYNKKTNQDCQPHATVTPLNQVYLWDTAIDQTPTELTITTTPIYGNQEKHNYYVDITVQVTSKTTKQSCILSSALTSVNTPITLSCVTSGLRYADDWVITIAADNPDAPADASFKDKYTESDYVFGE